MNIRNFQGETVADALKKATLELGPDAKLISTKQIRSKTITQKPLFEVFVATPEKEKAPRQKEPVKTNPYSNLSINTQQKNDDNDILLDISKAAQDISKIANIDNKEAKNIENESYARQINDISRQMKNLNEKVSMIADMIWDDKSPQDLIIPPEFSTIYKLAKNSGMKNEHLKAIMQKTIENMPTSMKSNSAAVTRYFYSLLRNMLPCRITDFDKKKTKVMMLVGPTGVGKTTTLSKLAYRFANEGDVRYKTGIITLDTYRLGAVEQLFQYAKIMSIPMIDAIDTSDFQAALKSLNHCDLILVDTMGSSQYDKEKILKLDKFLKESHLKVDVNLVLSADKKIEDLLEIYNNFSFLDIDTLIITKFDETMLFGNVFSLIYETNTPVSFFSIGQSVPDDIMEAKSEFLVKCVLEGFKKVENGSSE